MKTTKLALALTLAALSNAAFAQWINLDVIDSRSGRVLPEYAKRGDVWVPGVAGTEYKLRLTNTSGERVLAVVSIDGVNVLSGQTASTDQGGYVLNPYESVEVDGWRKSMRQTAAFYFSDLGDSYAARTGRPFDVGVIGLAAFREARPIPVWRDELRYGKDYPGAAESAPPLASAPSAESADRSAGATAKDRGYAQERPQPQDLGTGHGRRLASSAREVTFERRSSSPDQISSLRYDSYDALVAQGIVPRRDRYAYRPGPRAFPGGFVPDPR